jgi:hypothetical protein
MTNDTRGIAAAAAAEAGMQAQSGSVDWRALADQRLTRLIELEHDHAVMCDRLALLQVDYRELLVASEERLQRISEVDRARLNLEERLADLARERAHLQAVHMSFVESRSWRLTRPLRAMSRWRSSPSAGGLARDLLRIPALRRAARLVVRLLPGLHQRLRSRLYPQAGQAGRGDSR